MRPCWKLNKLLFSRSICSIEPKLKHYCNMIIRLTFTHFIILCFLKWTISRWWFYFASSYIYIYICFGIDIIYHKNAGLVRFNYGCRCHSGVLHLQNRKFRKIYGLRSMICFASTYIWSTLTYTCMFYWSSNTCYKQLSIWWLISFRSIRRPL